MDETLLADGFEEAFIGFIQRCGEAPIAIYSYEEAVNLLMERDKMTRYEAIEFLDYNVVGGWLGKGTPGFLIKCSLNLFKKIVEDEL